MSGDTEVVDFVSFYEGKYEDGLDDFIDYVSLNDKEVSIGDECIVHGVVWRVRSQEIVFKEITMEGIVNSMSDDQVFVKINNAPEVIGGMSGSPVFSINGFLVGMLLRYSEVTREATLLSKNAIKLYLGHEAFQ